MRFLQYENTTIWESLLNLFPTHTLAKASGYISVLIRIQTCGSLVCAQPNMIHLTLIPTNKIQNTIHPYTTPFWMSYRYLNRTPEMVPGYSYGNAD